MIWTIIASIAAAVSALFSAVAAILVSKQNLAKLQISVFNDIETEAPQNAYDPEEDCAYICVNASNKSPRLITILDCVIELDERSYHALPIDMNYDFNASVTLRRSEHVQKDFNIDDFTRLPMNLQSFQSENLYLLFPDFKHSNANIITGKISFRYDGNRVITKPIVIHKLSS